MAHEKSNISPPSPERQAELRAAYDENIAAGKPPYADVRVKSLGELQWIFTERGWSGENGPRYENEFADLQGVYFVGVNLRGVHLNKVDLTGARLLDSDISNADISGANLSNAGIIGTDFSGTDLSDVTFSARTFLADIKLLTRQKGGVWLQDIRWGGVDLTKVDWSQLRRLGDEYVIKMRSEIYGYRTVARAYRQLATQLRNQGISEDADRFAYRAQLWQRRVLLRTWRLPQYLFSVLLDALAGYGYHPERSFFWYLASVFGFALAYMHFGVYNGHPFHFDEALIFSLTSFHGRGFFPGGLSLDDAITKFAAGEAVIGLFIEISFIATFTQRFFGK